MDKQIVLICGKVEDYRNKIEQTIGACHIMDEPYKQCKQQKRYNRVTVV